MAFQSLEEQKILNICFPIRTESNEIHFCILFNIRKSSHFSKA